VANQKSANPYLDKTLDAYRSAVKAWGRDTLISSFIFMVAGFFIVLPFIHWSEKEQMLRAEIEQDVSKRQRIEASIEQVRSLQKEFSIQKQKIVVVSPQWCSFG